jgi:FkbM family methyltransferase
MEKIPATVGILTFNSGKVLKRALDSVADFDDLVICDGGSTDDTLEIARACGARVISQDARHKNPDGTLHDFGGVRQQLLEAAKHDWFLYIDSDETISDGLREEIRSIAEHPYTPGEPLVYRVPYGIVMDDRPLKYSSNFPGYQFRFFNRTSGAHFIKKVHERISFDTTNVAIGTLKNPWYTYSSRANAWNYLRDTRPYRQLEARMFQGRSFSDYFNFIILRCLRTFAGVTFKATRNYLLHGFKDTAPLGDEVGRALSALLTIVNVTAARYGTPKELLWRAYPAYFRRRSFHYITHPNVEAIATRRAEAELFILPELLRQSSGGAFIDVGANAGAYVYVASKHIPAQEIYAFEPQEKYVRRLRALFSKIHVEQIALSSSTGEARFKVPEIQGRTYPTRGTLESFVETGESGAQYEVVPLMRFDEYRSTHGITAIRVIKIDVEGHERSVLEGMQQTLAELHPSLIIEVEQRHHAEPIGGIFAFLQGLGYAGWFYDSHAHAIVALEEFSVATHQRSEDFKTASQVNNFLFLPAGVAPPPVKSPL